MVSFLKEKFRFWEGATASSLRSAWDDSLTRNFLRSLGIYMFLKKLRVVFIDLLCLILGTVQVNVFS